MSTGDRERPWWASDVQDGAAHGSDDPHDDDPRGGDGPRAAGGWTGGDRGDPGERADRGGVPPWPHADGEVCQVCPICAFLRVVGETRPEVMEHLVEAAHHLTLAAKAVVDAHAEGFERDGGLERIELDDD